MKILSPCCVLFRTPLLRIQSFKLFLYFLLVVVCHLSTYGQTTYTWVGGHGNNHWSYKQNWQPNTNIPSITDDVIIPDTGNNYPILDKYNSSEYDKFTGTAKSVTINAGGRLAITNEGILLLTDHLTINGELKMDTRSTIEAKAFFLNSSNEAQCLIADSELKITDNINISNPVISENSSISAYSLTITNAEFSALNMNQSTLNIAEDIIVYNAISTGISSSIKAKNILLYPFPDSEWIIDNCQITVEEKFLSERYIRLQNKSLVQTFDLELTNSEKSKWEVTENSVAVITNKLLNTSTMYFDSSSCLIQTSTDDLNEFNSDNSNSSFTTDRITRLKNDTEYIYWSSPVQNYNLKNTDASSLWYTWNPSADNGGIYKSNFGKWQPAPDVMEIGKGYSLSVLSTEKEISTTENDYLQKQTFQGKKPHNGTIKITIAHGGYNDGTYIEGLSSIIKSNEDDNWNLLGNPYPSPISIDKFLIENQNVIEGGIRISTQNTPITANNDSYNPSAFTQSATGYLTYNLTGTDIPGTFSGYLASGQGCFVAATHSNEIFEQSVTFTNAMRELESDDINSNFYYTDPNLKSRLWLTLTANTSKKESTTLLGYLNGATNGKDPMFDSVIMDYNTMSLYSLLYNEAMIIQGRGLPFIASDEIPLGVIIKEKDIYSISKNQVDGVFKDTNQDIYLEDLYEGKVHNLNESPYLFISEPGIINNRFVLNFQAQKLNINTISTQTNITIIRTQDKIKLKAKGSPINTINIYDITGRTLLSVTCLNTFEITLDQFPATNSPLIIKTTLVNRQQNTQKIIF